jgi:Winged helix-turn helix
MRGRKPHPLSIDPADLAILQQIARSDSLSWYQVRRARIVLANAQGVHNTTVASQVQCNEATVWRTCRRYERGGLTELLAPSARPGSPGRISPPPAGTDRPARLPGAGGQGPAHHPLVE